MVDQKDKFFDRDLANNKLEAILKSDFGLMNECGDTASGRIELRKQVVSIVGLTIILVVGGLLEKVHYVKMRHFLIQVLLT
ncbi:MAG: hypothetical protein M3115_04315 [Thermoproteota archaeon]|nr:hypothetical protein [Thermoproteota archaeon]